MVSAGQMVVRLARLDQRDAVFAVAESAIGQVHPGDPVEVALLDAPQTRAVARVAEIAPVADATTRTYTVKAALPVEAEALRYGRSVLGHFVTGEVRAAALPGAALVQAGGRPALWVVDPATGAVALQPVTLLRYEAGRVLVTDGVAEGALVVVAGVQSLRPGEKVQPIQAPAP